MIFTLALTAAALASPSELDDLQPRSSAAQVVRNALEQAPGVVSLATGVATARATIGELGPGAFSATLEESITDARWLALTDPILAGKRLEQDLWTAVEDLEFRPVREAELPSGFPEPTPVREIALKRYPRYRTARAKAPGRGSTDAFWKLLGHIKESGVAMTAPVEMTYEGEVWRESQMAFLYGSPYMGKLGRVGEVEVVDVEPGWVLSIGCRGSVNRASLDAARSRLMAWVEGQAELEVAGEFRSLEYNSPLVTDSRRFFELQIPMRARTDATPAEVVIDFGEENAAERWSPVNDGVMGGLSSSRFVSTGQGSCVFEGHVSLENNGGFASVRTRPSELELEGAKALRLAFSSGLNFRRFRLGM